MAVPAKINPDHHHYLHASDLPGLALVSPPFDGSGYGVWRKYILIALSAKNKLCFIDGSLSRPKDDSPDSKYWIRCDYMVFPCVLNALTSEIRPSVIHSKSFRILWTQLEESPASESVHVYPSCSSSGYC
ncbi:PREDICTED: uncharacterized protein LOC109242281 isoform X3 [Nicotiana attenuata]|uniref:uncharacterized protein LOC109242281 isoform X3 n=1 Tax=Nicotiana attenuata TaxID=49451 RepID=UPI000904B4DE|nr:PREDICTED: uncharacterized protein LOC109242281 isoform X3 [Nicotiana attenuata]